jgi:hypothetical protein
VHFQEAFRIPLILKAWQEQHQQLKSHCFLQLPLNALLSHHVLYSCSRNLQYRYLSLKWSLLASLSRLGWCHQQFKLARGNQQAGWFAGECCTLCAELQRNTWQRHWYGHFVSDMCEGNIQCWCPLLKVGE